MAFVLLALVFFCGVVTLIASSTGIIRFKLFLVHQSQDTNNVGTVSRLSYINPAREDNYNVSQKVLPEDIISKFKLEHNLKTSSNLEFRELVSNTYIYVNGKEYNILDGREPVHVFAPDFTYARNGLLYDNPVRTKKNATIFKKNSSNGDLILVNIDAVGGTNAIQSIRIVEAQDGSHSYLHAIIPGIFVILNPEDSQDYHNQTDNVRNIANISGGRIRHRRELQGTTTTAVCNEYKTITLAMTYDSEYCSQMGGNTNADQSIEEIVAYASTYLYEVKDVCVKLKIGYLEAYCDPGKDPFSSLISSAVGACVGDPPLVAEFGTWIRNNRPSITLDAHHMFYYNTTNTGGFGCANTKAICEQKGIPAYGVEDMKISNDMYRRATLFAHELGHNIGLLHVPTSSNAYIMDAVGVGFEDPHIWSPESLKNLIAILPTLECLPVQPKNDPTNVPTTVSPTAAPTAAPKTNMPTHNPTTTAPTTVSTTNIPTNNPTTTAPTTVPTTKIPINTPTTTSPTISPTTTLLTTSPTTTSPKTAAPKATPMTTAPTANIPTIIPTATAPKATSTTTAPTTDIPKTPTTTASKFTPMNGNIASSSSTTSAPTATPLTTSPTANIQKNVFTTTGPKSTPMTASPATNIPISSPTAIAPTVALTTPPTYACSTFVESQQIIDLKFDGDINNVADSDIVNNFIQSYNNIRKRVCDPLIISSNVEGRSNSRRSLQTSGIINSARLEAIVLIETPEKDIFTEVSVGDFIAAFSRNAPDIPTLQAAESLPLLSTPTPPTSIETQTPGPAVAINTPKNHNAEYAPDGIFKLTTRKYLLCASIGQSITTGDPALIMSACHGRVNQLWTMDASLGIIRSVLDNTKCIGLEGPAWRPRTLDGAVVQLYDCGKSDGSDDNFVTKQWFWNSNGRKIKSAWRINKCLTSHNKIGNPLRVTKCERDRNRQIWKFEKVLTETTEPPA